MECFHARVEMECRMAMDCDWGGCPFSRGRTEWEHPLLAPLSVAITSDGFLFMKQPPATRRPCAGTACACHYFDAECASCGESRSRKPTAHVKYC
eukprot:364914-Chlamydomonas_euryale.AAC.8